MNISILALAASLLAGLLSMDARATDPPGESQMGGALTAREAGDETVWLDAGGQRVAALIRESSAKQTLGGVVLLQGIHESADASRLVLALRKALPVRGWTSLSLADPDIEAGPDFEAHLGPAAQVLGRLAAAVSYLNGKQTTPIAVIGHRGGALAAVHGLAQNPDPRVAAAVLVNLPDIAAEGVEKEMEKIKIPVLDIVIGSANRLDTGWAVKRKGLMKNNAHYRQVVIVDAGASLHTLEGMLVNRIHGWLKRELMTKDSGDERMP